MWIPFNTFTIHNLLGCVVTGSLAIMFYIVYLKAGRRRTDLLSANFIAINALLCLDYFLMDNLVPAGMSSLGWVGGPTGPELQSATLELYRWGWVIGIFFIPAQLHFVLCYCRQRNFLRRHIWVTYFLAALLIPLVWSSVWQTAPDAPIAATSSWAATLPWIPESCPAVIIPIVSCIVTQIYGLILLWKTRKISSTFSDSLSGRYIVFTAFVVQMIVTLLDGVNGALALPVPTLTPIGSGVMGVLLAMALIRSRVEADRARFQLKSEKAAMLECVPQPLFYVGDDSRIQWANTNAAEFAGKELSQLVGSRADNIWSKDQSESLPARKVFETGQPIKREIVREDDSTWIVHASPVMGTKGKPMGVIELATDITEIRRAQETLRDSNIKILMAREEERRRVAQDLHDSVAQGLTAMQMQLRASGMGFGDDTEHGQKFIQASIRCQKLGTEVRQISHQLYPPALDLLGFSAALDDILDQYRTTGLKCEFECTEDLRRARFSQNAEVALYRTVQEAINNATRHGHAKEICVKLAQSDGKLHLTVIDNGIGFDVKNNKQGLGMTSMKGRLDGIAGEMEIMSRSGRTSLSVTVLMENIAKSPDAVLETV